MGTRQLQEIENQTDEIDLSAFIKPLLTRWKTLLVCALIGAAIAFCISRFIIPKKYQSSASIFVKQNNSSLGLLQNLPIGLNLSQGTNSGYILTILESDSLKRYVVSQLHLTKRRDFTLGSNMAMADAVRTLANCVLVKQSKNGAVIIFADAYNPVLAADIANTMLDGLGKMIVRTSAKKTDFIAMNLDQTKQDLSKAEDEMRVFQQKNDVAAIEDMTKGMIQQLTEMDAKLLVVDIELQDIKSQLTNSVELNDLVDQQVREKALEASRDYIINARSELHGKLKNLPAVAVKYGRLERKIATLAKTFQVLTEQYTMAQITQQGEDGDYEIVDKAIPRNTKVSPHTTTNMITGAIIGLFISSIIVQANQSSPKRTRGRQSATPSER